MALAQVSSDLSDIIAYVTLEPCSFHNRTPSCAKTLIDAGIRTVVVGMPDPHPHAAVPVFGCFAKPACR